MTKLTSDDPETQSANVLAANVERLRTLFPEAFAEGGIDFDVLKQLLGGHVDGREEKYGLNWHGKRRARQLALTPSNGTLRPCPEESVDWDTTQNIMIEGDNLEVLKLLQKSYSGKVKLIYIDPPYNTGNEFIYPDDYEDNLATYLRYTSQVTDEGHRTSSNTEASGRFHTNWLNMMYARMVLARQLLREDGVVFASIDEHEISNLRSLMDEVFGEENRVAVLTLLCNPKGRSQDKYFATNHEYVVVYSKTPRPKGTFSVMKDAEQIEAEYPEEDELGRFRRMELRNTHREFGKHNRPNLWYPLHVDTDGQVAIEPGPGRSEVWPLWDDGFEGCWTWDPTKAKTDLGLLVGRCVNARWRVYRKSYASGAKRMLKTILTDKTFATERGQKVFNELFESKSKIFESPKSLFLLAELLRTYTSSRDIVLDFFAGSATTAHAVLHLNQEDGQRRRFVMVQLPSPTREGSVARDAGFENIADIGKERIRRVIRQVQQEQQGALTLSGGQEDLGRVEVASVGV